MHRLARTGLLWGSLAACLLLVSVTPGAVTAVGPEAPTDVTNDPGPLGATNEADGNATTTVDTSVASDESISGFTVGAGVLAVLAGGTLWYFRRDGG